MREVRERLKRIKTDSILGSGYLEGFIMDDPYPYSPGRAHRAAGQAAAALLEGRVVILVDGSPHVLIVPVELSMELQSPTTTTRIPSRGRSSACCVIYRCLSLLLPGPMWRLLISTMSCCPRALRITATREVPFPVVVEVLL